jgi:hypothetical protein
MGLVDNSQETTPSIPYLLFPSRTRKYVRLPVQQAYESVNSLVSEVSGSKTLESGKEARLVTKIRLGVLGATVTIRVFPEGEVSALDLVFSYRRAIYAALAVCVIVILLGLSVFRSMYTILGFALVLPLIYSANSSAVEFLDLVNRTLPLIEKQFAYRALMADRERWKAQPKDTEALYRRLGEKHAKTWGTTRVLDYKIAEYQTQGLTRNEAIRKAAEEEGMG